MSYTTLIDAATLKAHLGHPDWVVIDCRFSLSDAQAGQRAYRDSHLPDARYAHLDADLSGPINPATGRHPLPDPARLASTLGNWGIGPETQVVAYDDLGGMLAAARLWWLLRWLGHTACAVLDGGFPVWRAADLPLTAALPTTPARSFTGQPDDRLWLTTAQVQTLPAEALLLDARTTVRFRGELEPIDPVAGHIPGALNLPTEGNLAATGRFLPLAALKERFTAILGARAPHTVVHSCGSGITACHNLLAMEAAGLPGSRLYVGSWSEWIRNPDRPTATGEA